MSEILISKSKQTMYSISICQKIYVNVSSIITKYILPPPPPSHSTVVGKEEWVFINTILTYGWTGNRTLAALVRSSTTELPKPISTVHVPPTTKFSSSHIPNNNLYKLTKVPYNIRNKAWYYNGCCTLFAHYPFTAAWFTTFCLVPTCFQKVI